MIGLHKYWLSITPTHVHDNSMLHNNYVIST